MRCPHGGKFGVDIEDLEELDSNLDIIIACNRCNVYQACQDEYSKSLLKKKRKIKPSSPERAAERNAQFAAARARLADNPHDEDQPVNVTLDNLIYDVALDWLHGETNEELAFKILSKVVKRFKRHIDEIYKDELAYRTPAECPAKWARNDPKISQVLKRQPLIGDAWQYLYMRQRNLDAALMRGLKEQNKGWIDDKTWGHEKSGNQYELATFKTDAAFYADFGRHLRTIYGTEPSQNRMHLIITAFKKAGIIIELAGNKRNGFIVADGYYMEYAGRWIKHLFLKDTPEYRQALQTMTI